MKHKKSNRKPDVKKLTQRLLTQEFSDNLLGICFKGPWEDIDMLVSMLLKEEPSDISERRYRVRSTLEKAGYFTIISYDVWDELEEDEKQDWQSLWTPVKVKKAKMKAA